MADTTHRKTVLLKIEQDMDRAARAADQLAREMRDARLAEAELRAGTDQAKLAMVQKARALEDAKRAAKDAAAAHRRLKDELKDARAAAEKNALSMDNLRQALGGTAGAILAGGGLVAGLGILTGMLSTAAGKIKEFVRAGIEWSGTVRGHEREVQRLSIVVDNLISERALARLAAYSEEMGWSNQQMETLAKSAVHFARVAKVDFDTALQTVTNTVINCEQEGLRKLGLSLDDLSGTKSEKTARVLDELGKKFGTVTIEASNAGEEHARLENTLSQVTDRIGAAIVESKAYHVVVSGIAGEIEDWARAVGILDTKLQSLLISSRGWSKVAAELAEGYETDPDLYAKMMGFDEASAKKLEDLREKRAVQALQRQQDEYDRRLRQTEKHLRDDQTAHIKAWEQRKKDEEKWRQMERKAADMARVQQLKAELKLDSDLRKAHAARAAAEKKLGAERQRAFVEVANSALAAAAAEISASRGALENARAATSALFKELSSKATWKALWHAASAAGHYAAYAWSMGTAVNELTAGNFDTAAAIGYGALAGVTYGIGQAAGGGGGGGATSAPVGGTAPGGGSSYGGAGGGGPSGTKEGGPVTNIYLKGRSGLVTRKDLRAFAARLSQGRAV